MDGRTNGWTDGQTNKRKNKASYRCENASKDDLNNLIPKLRIFSDTRFTNYNRARDAPDDESKYSRSCWMNTGTNQYDVWAIAFMFGVSVIYVYPSIG